MSRLLRAVNVIKAPLMSAGRAYNSTAEKYPMLTGVVTTVVKTSAADLFAQKVGKAATGHTQYIKTLVFRRPAEYAPVVATIDTRFAALDGARAASHVVTPGNRAGPSDARRSLSEEMKSTGGDTACL